MNSGPVKEPKLRSARSTSVLSHHIAWGNIFKRLGNTDLEVRKHRSSNQSNVNFFINFFIRWLQMDFFAIFHMYTDLFALQHTADRPGEY